MRYWREVRGHRAPACSAMARQGDAARPRACIGRTFGSEVPAVSLPERGDQRIAMFARDLPVLVPVAVVEARLLHVITSMWMTKRCKSVAVPAGRRRGRLLYLKRP